MTAFFLHRGFGFYPMEEDEVEKAAEHIMEIRFRGLWGS